MGKPEGNRPLGRPSHSWEDNIKTDLQEVENRLVSQEGRCSMEQVRILLHAM